MHNGAIMGCPVIDRPELNEGNVKDRGLQEIWWKGFKRFRQVRPLDLPELCRNCRFVSTCRGGCWAQRLSGDKFCYLKDAEKLRVGAT